MRSSKIDMQISDSIIRLAEQAETALAPHFARIDRIAFANTAKVLDAFREHRVAANNLILPAATAMTTRAVMCWTGYGRTLWVPRRLWCASRLSAARTP